MAKQDKYSVKDLKKQFPNDAVCLEYLFDNLHSRECSCGGEYKPLFKWVEKDGEIEAHLEGRKQFQCSKCRFQIAPMASTIFEKSTSPLTLWFHAIWVFSNAKSGISAKELERQLGVTYKTAWRFHKLIRESLAQSEEKLKNDVEMDEGYFGGKGDGGSNNSKLGQAMAKKSKIIGAVERGGRMKAEVVPTISAKYVGQFLEKNVEKENTRLLTDKSNRYNKVAKDYNRQSVNHGKQEYVRGDVHVNRVEGFWGHAKRSIKGTHKQVSRKYLQSYLDGFVFHYDMRHNDRLRFVSLLNLIVRKV